MVLATLGVTAYDFMAVRKDYFPQGFGPITGVGERAQQISPRDAEPRLAPPGKVVLKAPDAEKLPMLVGSFGNPSNDGRLFITLKPRHETSPGQGPRE